MADLAAELQEALLGARSIRPYYARAIAALQPIALPGCKTIAVDKHFRLYYDPEWFEKQTLQTRAGVIALHEIEHLLRRHAQRSAAAMLEDKEASNACADAEINDDIPPGDLHLMPTDPPPFLPENLQQARGLTMEEYYAALPKVTIKLKCGACGSGSGGKKLEGELDASDADTPGMTEAEAEIIRRAVAEDVRQAEREKPGTVPAGILVWAEEELRPVKIDWRRRLRGALLGALSGLRGRDDYSWRHLGRRYSDDSPLRPGLLRRTLRVGVLIDTSGSMHDEGGTVYGVMASLKRSQVETITVACDAAAYGAIKGKVKGRLMGGGGTDLRHGFSELEKHRVGCVVVVTDCETPWPAQAPPYRVVVVATGKAASPAWAERVEVD